MSQTHNVHIQEENEVHKILEQVTRHYYLFIIGIVVALGIALLINQFSIPNYKVSASVLILEENNQQPNINDYINSNLFGSSQNLQNELEVIKSSPVLEQTVKNLNLPVIYFTKNVFRYIELYKNNPFHIQYLNSHVQPLNTRIEVSFNGGDTFTLRAESKEVIFWDFEKNEKQSEKKDWEFEYKGKFNEIIETPELSFIVSPDSIYSESIKNKEVYFFQFQSVSALVENLKRQITFDAVSREATVIQLSMQSESVTKGKDILNGILNAYSQQNLNKKNHLASITIDYINQQLGEISDSLNITEQKLQRFRSSNQVLDLNIQATGITQQYQSLQNQMAELVTRKRYFDNVENNLSQNDDFNNIAIPSSLGIQDPELNRQMGDLINAQAQKSGLIENKQEKNPLVQKLTIQINNLKKVVSENIVNARKTTEIAIDEMKKRISKIEAEISRMPNTERQLVGIERKFRLNDAIYNYLMEKRAEANITKASNLPDSEVIEPAKMEGSGPVSPNKKMNYIIAFILGLLIPFGFIQLKSAINNKLESQEQIEKITDLPVLGKILHNHKRNNNVVFESPNSSIAESFRALRTNLEFYVKGGQKKVILVTSSIEGEGKSFNALNIAMSYAQLNRKTILLDFDLRKPTNYFSNNGHGAIGLSSYLINKDELDNIIINSQHEKFDYIASGTIPPNPVELIGLERTEKLINQLKEQYDYIIIDTPPLAQVTDGYLLLGFADVKVIVARYNYTIKSVFAHIIKDLRQKNIDNVCIVLNDNRIYRDQYGYGYGYNTAKK